MDNINIIVAMDGNHAIGKGGRTPWRLSADMKHFAETTKEKAVVMGRKTWDSIPQKFRPLPGRENIVVTKNTELMISGCAVLCHPEQVLRIFKDQEVWVIGGGEMYNIFLPYARRLLITHVDTIIEDADTFFPEINGDWKSRPLFQHEVDEKNQFSFSVAEYTR